MSDLEERRREIDKIDKQIIVLIAKRKEQVEGVIRAKAASNMAAHQPARFEDVLVRCRQLAIDNQLDPDVIETIWHELHRYFLTIEEKELS